MNTGKIIKGKSTGNFTVIPNHIFEDQRIGLKEIGLLCYLLKLPPNWAVNKSRLHVNVKDGRDAVINAFDNLLRAGYIQSEEIRDKGRFLGFNYIVNETATISDNPPIIAKKPRKIKDKPKPEKAESVAPKPENPKPGKPKPENTELINKILTKDCTNKISLPFTNVNDKGAKSEKGIYTKFIFIYDEWFKENNEGTPPKIDGAQGNAAKSLIGYFRAIVKARTQKDNPDQIFTLQEFEEKTLEAWKLVLQSWDRLEPFYQDKTRLTEINSHIQNIIQQIKNGNKKQPVNGGKIDRGGVDAMHNEIDRKYGKVAGI